AARHLTRLLPGTARPMRRIDKITGRSDDMLIIRDWPAAERPREKLLEWGATSLSDAELLAIFLRTGVTGRSAVDLARHLLAQFG
ncbi:UPF0758 domain-containing protein, partial [Klebsiella pneumoniae]|uniref:UPF0758 domain-containing protein n=1 Tax=Klebsiella pneumoniae TaxID=573 RepID=UPI00275E8507|nr:hypothetical protein [Klebsiella pneumoniae]